MNENEAIVVLCTAPDPEVAASLAQGLVEAGLAACVNVLPGVRSFYLWEGELHQDGELQLVIKSHRDRFDELEAWLMRHHPYDVPEVLALPVMAGSAPYLAWMRERLRR